jgi:hypothetical protein
MEKMIAEIAGLAIAKIGRKIFKNTVKELTYEFLRDETIIGLHVSSHRLQKLAFYLFQSEKRQATYEAIETYYLEAMELEKAQKGKAKWRELEVFKMMIPADARKILNLRLLKVSQDD